MKKLYILAALLMATTSAHAGNGISFQINGERIRVEAPRNCNALSCIRITAPGYSGTVGNIDLKGIGSKSKDDDDFADTTPAKPATAPAPVQAAACSTCRDLCARPGPDHHRLHRAGSGRRRSTCACTGPPYRAGRAAGPGCRSASVRPELAAWRLGDRREQGQRADRAVRIEPLRLCRQER
jgi:hypothetical protein